jgi:hypothetical protein
MNDRYPHLRFLIDAAPFLAGSLALLFFLGATMRACHHGGAWGFFGFLFGAAFTALVYVIVRARIETLQVWLDIENELRDLAAVRDRGTAPAPKV